MTTTIRCPVTITSPAPTPGMAALGIQPSMRCGAEVHINAPAGAVVLCRCPQGHEFTHYLPLVEHKPEPGEGICP
jgi:hypothetical protein